MEIQVCPTRGHGPKPVVMESPVTWVWPWLHTVGRVRGASRGGALITQWWTDMLCASVPWLRSGFQLLEAINMFCLAVKLNREARFPLPDFCAKMMINSTLLQTWRSVVVLLIQLGTLHPMPWTILEFLFADLKFGLMTWSWCDLWLRKCVSFEWLLNGT